MTKKKLLIGAHVSIAGGFDHAITRGEAIGATCIQIFTKSNRQWAAKPIDSDEIKKFITAQKQSNIECVVVHASYLINLASDKKAVVKQSIDALIEELERCELLHIPYLVLHPGSSTNQDIQTVLELVADHINTVLSKVHLKHTMLLLENMAGQGSTIGKTFTELATIIQHVKQKKRIGICIDTCHLFVAGYEFHDKKTYQQLIKHIDETVGIDKIKVIHVNDSKKECGSKIDRHEHIGKGKINPKSFQLIMHDAHFADVPKILETPKEDNDVENDKKNLDKLREFAS